MNNKNPKLGETVTIDEAVKVADKTWNLDRTPIMSSPIKNTKIK